MHPNRMSPIDRTVYYIVGELQILGIDSFFVTPNGSNHEAFEARIQEIEIATIDGHHPYLHGLIADLCKLCGIQREPCC